jgi:hypothetical protein
VVIEELMSTSVGGGGGEAGVCVWRWWFGDCGGLANEGDDGGGWLKCSGCSTLTLIAKSCGEGAFEVGRVDGAGTAR